MSIKKTRGEAIAAKDKTYFTGVPCKKGHIAIRTVKGSNCMECQREASRKERAKVKELFEAIKTVGN